MSLGLKFLYHTLPGRVCLKLLTKPWISEKAGHYLDSPKSKKLIPSFIKKNHIDMSEYIPTEYESFNDFFSRKIILENRPFSEDKKDFCSPCDGALSVYRIQDGLVLPIKQSAYSIRTLLESDELADKFDGGLCLVFRLGVHNYHRYDYAESGILKYYKKIPGILHTVRPIALEEYPVFTQNSREVSVYQMKNGKHIAQVEVGAMLVGKIENFETKTGTYVHRGTEKGRFLYGGSTIVVLLEKDHYKMSSKFKYDVQHGIEIPVIMGEKLLTRV